LLASLTSLIPAVVGIPPADIRDVSNALPLLMFLVLLLFPESLLILVSLLLLVFLLLTFQVLLVSLLWLASLMPLPFLLSASTVFWLAPILLHCADAAFIPVSASVPIAGGVPMLLVLMLALQALLL